MQKCAIYIRIDICVVFDSLTFLLHCFLIRMIMHRDLK